MAVLVLEVKVKVEGPNPNPVHDSNKDWLRAASTSKKNLPETPLMEDVLDDRISCDISMLSVQSERCGAF